MAEEFMVDRGAITRPGVLFERDILPALGRRTPGQIAALLGVSRQTLHRMMAGAVSVTPEMAVRLGKLCGNGLDLWMTLQARYDIWHANRKLKKELASIPTLRD